MCRTINLAERCLSSDEARKTAPVTNVVQSSHCRINSGKIISGSQRAASKWGGQRTTLNKALRIFRQLLGFTTFLLALLVYMPVLAIEDDPLVVMVTPRGRTAMESSFEADLKRRLGGRVRFTLIVPDVRDKDAMEALPDRIRKEKPSLIYTWGTPTTVAVAGTHDKPLINDIPIVFAVVADPIRAGIVKSIRRPSRNITGTSHLAPLSIQINAIESFRPFKKLGVVYNPGEPNSRFMLDDLNAAASQLGFELIAEAVTPDAKGLPDSQSLPRLVRKLKERGAEWLYIGPDTFVGFTHRKTTTAAAAEAGLPSFTANESAIRDGNALFGLFSPQENMSRFVAFKAALILHDKIPAGSIPIETLQRFSVLVNMCTAKALDVYPPLPLLNIADVRLPAELGPSSAPCVLPITPGRSGS